MLLNNLFIVGRRLFQSSKRSVRAKVFVITVRETYQGSLLVILVRLLRFLEGNIF